MMLLLLLLVMDLGTGDTVLVENADGERIKGVVVEQDEDSLVLRRGEAFLTFDRTAVTTTVLSKAETAPIEPPAQELSEQAQILLDLAQTPRGRPKLYSKAWRALGKKPLAEIRKLPAGNPVIEREALELVTRFVKDDAIDSELLHLLEWCRTDAVKVVAAAAVQLGPRRGLGILVDALATRNEIATGPCVDGIRTLTGKLQDAASLKVLKHKFLKCLHTCRDAAKPVIAETLGSGLFDLTPVDWRNVMGTRDPAARTSFFRAVHANKVRVPRIEDVTKRIGRARDTEAEAVILLITSRVPMPILTKDQHRELHTIALTSKDPAVRDGVHKLLRIQTGNNWTLVASQWKKYFAE